MPILTEQHRIKSALAKINLSGILIISILICINLYIAMYLQGRSLPLGNIRMMVLVFLLAVSQYLIGIDRSKVSAFITHFAILLAFMIYPILTAENKPLENIFLVLFIWSIGSILTYITYNIKSERAWIFGWISIISISSIVALVLNFKTLDINDYGEILRILLDQPILILAYLFVLLFLNLLIFHYRNENHDQSTKILIANTSTEKRLLVINYQTNQLEEQKIDLIKVQEELKNINNGLEEKVRDRTRRLEAQNEVLKKYGFINSKLIRSPIIKLKKTLEKDGGQSLIICEERALLEMKGTINDLEVITSAISDVLNNFDTKKIDQVEKLIQKKYSK